MGEIRKVEITSLKIKLGKIEATLTIDEAKKLKKALEEIFGVREVEVIRDRSYPVYIEKYPWRPYWNWEYGKQWCSSQLIKLLEMKDNGQMLCSIQE